MRVWSLTATQVIYHFPCSERHRHAAGIHLAFSRLAFDSQSNEPFRTRRHSQRTLIMASPFALAAELPLAPVSASTLRCVCLDIESPRSGEAAIYKFAAFRSDTGERVLAQGPIDSTEFQKSLDRLVAGATCVLGHNIRQHDLPVLRQLYPALALHRLPIVDTLELSPIAFPENPYHHLVKDYKLVSDARNRPLRDAELSLKVFDDVRNALHQLKRDRPNELALLHFLLAADQREGIAWVLTTLRGARRPTLEEAGRFLTETTAGKVCQVRVRDLVSNELATKSLHLPLAYVVAWLRVAGTNSVVPPWVHRAFPDVTRLIRELREVPCNDLDCRYCGEQHNPETLLNRYFSLSSFRARPQNATGGSLQRDVIHAGLSGDCLLAILPTGSGKSICYQLPALAHYWRSGKLTVIVSPLQSLMKDQIDNLIQRGIYCGVALNGLLTPLERKEVLQKIALGDAGLVLVSPEQFRNRSFVAAIKQRQIATWVFDEAHCLSKWGQDFRTDYIYVSRFIREQFGHTPASVACFTATAKPDVIADLKEHFKAELGVELRHFAGGHERENLDYEVALLSKSEKPGRILALLSETLTSANGSAIVFASTRKNAETLAIQIKEGGWSCEYFHAGLEPGTKREIQQNFVQGALRIIVATNAFGMGVDKPDVRLVVHADIPGSLENYLQEAGRAGRDSERARCVLLYDEEDVETQFRLSAHSRLTRSDFAGILRGLHRLSKKVRGDCVVVTPRELLTDDQPDIRIDPEARDAETKVKTAIAWLERSRLIAREENQTRVFAASLKVASLEDAVNLLASCDLTDVVRKKYLHILAIVMGSDAADGISTDELMTQTGISADECFRTLQNLEQLGLLRNDLGLRVVLRKGVKDASDVLFSRVAQIENALIAVMRESAPDAHGEAPQLLVLRSLCEGVRQRLNGTVSDATLIPEKLLDLLRALAHGFGEGERRRPMLTLRRAGIDQLEVSVKRSWRQIQEIAEKRQSVARVLLATLLQKLPAGLQSADAIVECKFADLTEALENDLVVRGQLKDLTIALEHGLLYLHETGVVILDKGRTVFRSAMTIRVLARDGGNRFLKEDFEPLQRYYSERNFQIHVMQEYARLGARKVADAIRLVSAYFSLSRDGFVKAFFGGHKELLEFATTAESYRRIVEDLRHPVQQQLVQAKEVGNRLVLAGPGSGKTKVIVHRVAYLLRVLRVAPDSIIVLAFNRSAAMEIRRRLRELVGNDAYHVTVLTYHAMALRLTGVSLAMLSEVGETPRFDELIDRAVELLEGRGEVGADPDESRDRLLRGYRFILVDEYQDIDERQYGLVSALAGRTRKDDSKLSILAVGDDDQNIYSFRDTSVKFIHRFERDYEADKVYLVENFRSTQNIIDAANQLISSAPDRMKIDHPIRINYARAKVPRGGRWQDLDEVGRGLVQVWRVPRDRNIQAQLAMAEIDRLRGLDPSADWSDFALLARTHASLEPMRAYCEVRGVAYLTGERAGGGVGLSATQTRHGQRILRTLRGKTGRLVGARVLIRWLDRLARSADGDPWLAELRQCTVDLERAVGAARISRMDVVEWLFESAGAHAREARGHLNLCTAHGVKGREFKHVVVLDPGDWKADSPDERRLLYVAMTRAKETLTLLQPLPPANQLMRELEDSDGVRVVEPKVLPIPRPELNRIHRDLTLRDVDIGFSGRQPAGASVHRAITMLKVGDELTLKDRDLLDSKGTQVGRLAKNYQIASRHVQRIVVTAIVVRSKNKGSENPLNTLTKVGEWETVLCSITFAEQSPSRLFDHHG
jgi:ATP-dependent DNA helicase RecQ